MPENEPPRHDTAALLSAVAAGGEDLVNGRGWPDGVNTLLAELGEVTKVSRVWIFQTLKVTEKAVTQDYVFEWAKDAPVAQIGMKAFSMFDSSLELEEYRTIVEGRMRGEPYQVIPRTMEPSWLRDTLYKDQNVHSMLTIPIMVEGEWWGTLGFDDCEREYRWTEAEVSLLRAASAFISSAIIRQRLSTRLQQFSILKGMTESAAWAVDLRTRRAWYTSDLLHPGQEDIITTSLEEALDLIDNAGKERLRTLFFKAEKNGEKGFRADVCLTISEGDKWVEVIGNIMRDTSGTPIRVSGIAVDIRARKIREARLLRQAETDALTGCYNRHVFEDSLEAEFTHSIEDNTPLSLLVIDIDHFKNVNDSYGHPVGDAVIRWVADQVRQVCRKHDLLSRIGGEEFGVIMPGADIAAAGAVAERIRASIASKLAPTESGALPISVSLGCATLEFPRHETHTRLFHEADRALYAAKRAGRNKVRQAR